MQTKITANELREKYLRFFEERGHAIIHSASVIPENDPTVLFTIAGMHPLIPYFMGQMHPAGPRLADVQKCVRTIDFDEVGDDSHLTSFEMLGNWSLGDYFKEEAIRWSWEFLTDPKWLGLDKERLAVTVFEGNDEIPRDEESAAIWQDCGLPKERIFYLGLEHNWWGPAGLTGPCGPDSEMFMITDTPACGPDCSPACSCGHYFEIWNDVFMMFNKTADGKYEPLARKNVDTGMGLERTLRALQGAASVYDTDVFEPIFRVVEGMCSKKYGESPEITKAFRIVCDHIRTATIILGDERGVTPSNADQGYILRRLIRRAVRLGLRTLGLESGFTARIAEKVIGMYADVYPELERNGKFITEQLLLEEDRFARTLVQGMKELNKVFDRLGGTGGKIDGKTAFKLYDTYGFPIEMTVEIARDAGFEVDEEGFKTAFENHQKLSQAGAEQRFKGGLADNAEQTTRLHTATHLLHAALRKVLGDTVAQKGSNITAERLRFDFSFPRKVTPDELKQVEALVNEAIDKHIPITVMEMTVDEAKELGAIGLFESRYGEMVKVYTMGDVSCEICGGPHAGNTGELNSFKIQKEESSSAGVRRIKAVIK